MKLPIDSFILLFFFDILIKKVRQSYYFASNCKCDDS